VAKLGAGEIAAARNGESRDPAAQAALTFARRVLDARGHVADAELGAVRAAGFDDAAVIEIVANVALNVLTNYINSMAQTDIDFPRVGGRSTEKLAA
jgi:alkylhydroperoxidase family enzyme